MACLNQSVTTFEGFPGEEDSTFQSHRHTWSRAAIPVQLPLALGGGAESSL